MPMKLNLNDKLFNKEERTNTPKRVAKFHRELAANGKFKFKTFPNPDYDQMVILREIEFSSLCSHHLLPFTGMGHIGYVPNKRICGISKLARALDKFAGKPQLQERLTEELANFLEQQLKPFGVMVVLDAQHCCMRCRGVKKQSAIMTTSALRGVFKNDIRTREEFLRLIKR